MWKKLHLEVVHIELNEKVRKKKKGRIRLKKNEKETSKLKKYIQQLIK